MKKKILKISLGVGGVAGILTASIAAPLISCSNTTETNIVVDRYPQSFNEQKFDEIIGFINQGTNFNNPNYQKESLFVFDGIKNTLNENQKHIINNKTINANNYVKHIGYSNDNKYLVIQTISNGKAYSFSFLRSHGDIYYEGNNKASISGFNKNYWPNILNYNNSQFSQKYIDNFYKTLGITININDGNLKPWLTNGYYDGINKCAIFTLYGYDDKQPFNYNSANLICNVGFNNKGVRILSDINKFIDTNKLNIESTKPNLWKNKDDVINIINVLNTFTNTTFDATNNLIGDEKQILNGIETNLSRLMQAIGNVQIKDNAATINNTLINLLKANNVNINLKQINTLLSQLVNFCQNPETYAIYNQILNSVNHFLKLDVCNHFIDLNVLNQTFKKTIIENQPYLLSSDFLGFVKIFNMFDIWATQNDKNEVLENNLWSDFVKEEFNGWGLNITNKIVNDWLMINSPENIYFENHIVPEKNISGKVTKKISGDLYLKIVNNTNVEQKIIFLNQTYTIPVNDAFNFYLNIKNANLTPYVYCENNQYKLGLNISGSTESFYKIGCFNKDATNILNESNFKKTNLNEQGIILNNLTACAGNVENVQVNEIKQEEKPIATTDINTQINDGVKKYFQNNIINTNKFIKNLKIITSEFSQPNNTILEALSNSAPAINFIFVELIKGIVNLTQDKIGNITNLISIINFLIPNNNSNETQPTMNFKSLRAKPTPILTTFNNSIPYLKKIINYVPHYYVTLSNGKIIDSIGEFVDGTYQKPNQKTILEMIGNLIQGLLTSYQNPNVKDKSDNVNNDINNESPIQKIPYAIWDFAYDHIDDVVGILASITPIMNMIPNNITNKPIINNSQWQPLFPNNKKSPLDSIIPVIITNFFNPYTGAKKSKEEIKKIIENLDGIAPAIEGLLSNGGLISPATLALITSLIIDLSATANINSEGQSLLSFISSKGETIVNLLKGVNSYVGLILGSILRAFTGNNNCDNFLNVTIKDLNEMEITNPDNSTSIKMNFWKRLEKNLNDISSEDQNFNNLKNTLISIVKIINFIAPNLGNLLNIISNPIDEKGNPIELSENDINVNLIEKNNPQKIEISFAKTVCFDVTEMINKIKLLIDKIIGPINILIKTTSIGGPQISNPFKANVNINGVEKYFIKFVNPIIYDLNDINPTYSNIGNNLLINGLSAHLNKESNIGNILGFIDFVELNKLVSQIINVVNNIDSILNNNKWIIDILKKYFPDIVNILNNIKPILNKIKPILNIVIDILSLNNYDNSSLGYFIINLLLPNFGSLNNLIIQKDSNLQINSNEIDPTNYVIFDKKEITDLDIPNLEVNKIKDVLKNNPNFGSAFWKNIDTKKASLSNDEKESNIFVYKTLVPLIGIDNQGNRRQINGVKFNFKTVANNKYNLTLEPLYSDTIFTTNIRNLIYSLLNSNIIQTIPNTKNVELSSYGTSVIKLLDKYINLPFFQGLANEFKVDKLTNEVEVTVNIEKAYNHYLTLPTKNIALANLTQAIDKAKWTSNDNDNTKFNLAQLIKISNDSKFNKVIEISEIGDVVEEKIIFQKKYYQIITLKIQDQIIKVKINFNKNKPATPVVVDKTFELNPIINISPINAANQLFTTLYQIANNSDGIFIESQWGTILGNIYDLIYSLYRYYPMLNSINSVIKILKELLNTFIPKIIANANNQNWWLNIQNILSFILKFINK